MKGIVLCLLVLVASTFAYKEEEGVLSLTGDDFPQIFTDHPLLMIAFYAPWCHHCKELLPEYEKAAKTLMELSTPIRIAKIDATENEKIATQYEVKGYPTIKLFVNDITYDYLGTRDAEHIVEYIKKKSKGPVFKTDSLAEIEDFRGNSIVLLSTMDDTKPDKAEFYALAPKIQDNIFLIECFSQECKDKYQSSVVLLTSFDQLPVKFPYDQITVETLRKFISIYSIELGGVINEYTADAIFDYNRTCLFYFRNDGNVEQEAHDAFIKKIALEYRDQLAVFIQDIKGGDSLLGLTAEFFFVREKDLPMIQIINILNEEDIRMHVLKNKVINEETVRQFIKDYYDGKIPKEPLSEPYPSTQSQEIAEGVDVVVGTQEEVKVLVGRNFNELVIENNMAVFVLFIQKECIKCEDVLQLWNELGIKYKESEDVLFAKINHDLNEVPGIEKQAEYPAMKLYLKNDKQNPIDFVHEEVSMIDVEEWMAWKFGWQGEPVKKVKEPVAEKKEEEPVAEKKDDL